MNCFVFLFFLPARKKIHLITIMLLEIASHNHLIEIRPVSKQSIYGIDKIVCYLFHATSFFFFFSTHSQERWEA